MKFEVLNRQYVGALCQHYTSFGAADAAFLAIAAIGLLSPSQRTTLKRIAHSDEPRPSLVRLNIRSVAALLELGLIALSDTSRSGFRLTAFGRAVQAADLATGARSGRAAHLSALRLLSPAALRALNSQPAFQTCLRQGHAAQAGSWPAVPLQDHRQGGTGAGSQIRRERQVMSRPE